MKFFLFMVAIAFSIVSCNSNSATKEVAPSTIDTIKPRGVTRTPADSVPRTNITIKDVTK